MSGSGAVWRVVRGAVWRVGALALSGAVLVVAEGPARAEVAPLEVKLTPAGGAQAVAVSGDTVVVRGLGAAYVYTPDGAGGRSEVELTPSDAPEFSSLERSVAVDGDTIVVGANADDEAAPTAGAAYVYTPDGAGGYTETKLMASDAAADDRFGSSVAISGDTIVVGAYGEDSSPLPGSYAGAAYVYEADGLGGYTETKLTPAVTGEHFGYSVAVDGDTIVVGSFAHAYVFEPDGLGGYDETWLEGAGGESVAVSDGTVVVGDRDRDNYAGAASVFEPDGLGGYTETVLTASDAAAMDRFGWSVAISGDRVLVGAMQDDHDPMGAPWPAGVNAGSAYVYDPDGAGAYTATKLTAFDAAPAQRFGYSVALSGDTLAVAASNAHAAYVYSAVAPGPPTIGSATAGDGEATVSWTAPASDGGSPITGYVVTPYVGYSPQPSQTFASAATTQVVTGLTNGTQHRFRVRAINAVGTSTYSTVTNPVTPQPTVTVTPSTGLEEGQTVTVTGSGFASDVSLVGLAQCDGPQQSCAGQTVVPASGGAFSTTFVVHRSVLGVDCGVAPGTCVLGASNLNGSGAAFVQRSLVPLSFATAPGAPTIIQNATAGHGEATVSWTAPATDGGAPITRYRITPYVGYSPRPSVICSASAATAAVTGLVNDTTYRFRVQATNALGTGGYSTVTNPVTPTASGAAAAGTTEVSSAGRPAELRAPGCVTALSPLVVLLHGYSASAAIQNGYLHVSEQAATRGLYVLLPNGTPEVPSGNRFWDAMPACCNFNGPPVDDVGYLDALIDQAIATRPIDPDRVYVLGHSNGGFMAYRLACELSQEVAAIAVLAGSDYGNASDCGATGRQPVSVLHLHGDADVTIPYLGDDLLGAPLNIPTSPYPGAEAVRDRWAALAGCDPVPVAGAPIDFIATLPGAETTVTAHTGCADGIDVQLDTIVGGGHIPTLDPARVGSDILDWLLDHRR
jgi:polyhydroxybutyrate depolymerase